MRLTFGIQPGFEPFEPLFDADPGLVTQFLPGSTDVKPMAGGQFLGQKACHGRLALEPQSPIEDLAQPAGRIGQTGRNRPGHGWKVGCLQNAIDKVPKRNRLIL